MLSNLWILTQFHLPKLQLHPADGQTRHLKPPPSPSDGQNVTSHPTAMVSLSGDLSRKCEELEHVTGFRLFSGNKVQSCLTLNAAKLKRQNKLVKPLSTHKALHYPA